LFATGVVDTGHWWQICRWYQQHQRNLWQNLPLVSLIPVVHLDLRISPRILKKFEMTLVLFSGAWGKIIHEKNLEQKIS
jgi:hypothetical protein